MKQCWRLQDFHAHYILVHINMTLFHFFGKLTQRLVSFRCFNTCLILFTSFWLIDASTWGWLVFQLYSDLFPTELLRCIGLDGFWAEGMQGADPVPRSMSWVSWDTCLPATPWSLSLVYHKWGAFGSCWKEVQLDQLLLQDKDLRGF